MVQNLAGKTAAITGAGSGIGFECARHLVARGVKTFLVDRNVSALRERAEELGDLAVPIEVDLLLGESQSQMLPRILQHTDRLDISTPMRAPMSAGLSPMATRMSGTECLI
jgi:ribitol 2-dehydrogenase